MGRPGPADAGRALLGRAPAPPGPPAVTGRSPSWGRPPNAAACGVSTEDHSRGRWSEGRPPGASGRRANDPDSSAAKPAPTPNPLQPQLQTRSPHPPNAPATTRHTTTVGGTAVPDPAAPPPPSARRTCASKGACAAALSLDSLCSSSSSAQRVLPPAWADTSPGPPRAPAPPSMQCASCCTSSATLVPCGKASVAHIATQQGVARRTGRRECGWWCGREVGIREVGIAHRGGGCLMHATGAAAAGGLTYNTKPALPCPANPPVRHVIPPLRAWPHVAQQLRRGRLRKNAHARTWPRRRPSPAPPGRGV